MYSVDLVDSQKTTDFGALFQNTFGNDIRAVQCYILYTIILYCNFGRSGTQFFFNCCLG